MKLFKKREKLQEQIKPILPLKTTICNICGGEAKKVFSDKMLNKYDVEYYYCYDCEHLQTQTPFWLEEAYNNSITTSDTGIMCRNLMFQEDIAKIIYKLFDKNAKFVDFAGGYGLFTRLMRDIGFDFYWCDKYSDNLVARGFEYKEGEKVELVCAFEAIEHFPNPLQELEAMFKISDNVIVSQSFLPYPLPQPRDWWYYGLEHGQHISFYSIKTFEYIAKKYNKNLCSYSNLHLFTSKDISQSEFKKAIKKTSIKKIKKEMKSKTEDDMNFIISQSKDKN